MSQTLTVNLPSNVYARLKARAELARHSIEDELLGVLAGAMTPDTTAAPETQPSFAALNSLDDEALRRAARSRLATELAHELETLHFKQQREGLSEAEAVRCAELIGAYERAMLIRAQAVALLKNRGIDITALAALP